ncbi:MAG TPA: MYXO-CTERM sorting domain-containing protein [Polyangia bacterium]
MSRFSASKRVLLAASLVACGATSGRAVAMEVEPNGLSVPQLPSATEIAAAAAATPTSEIHLDRLIISRGEMLESLMDAHLPPAGFAPLCDMTAQLVLRGGTCAVDLGWYNVVPGQTTAPTADQIFSLVPAPDPITMPRADYTPGVGVQNPIATLAKIRKDARYLGGLIGFAMMGNDRNSTPVCTQTHFSNRALDPLCMTADCMNQPWITALMYQSTAMTNAYYFLFEERPVTAIDFGNDGDFNDQVFLVTGVTCDGGGLPCDTGKLGVCKAGTTQCGKLGALTCVQNVASSTDVCDGLDNDCDGVIDPDAAACANPAQICDRGRCVDECDDTVNPCGAGFVCDLGACKVPTCVGITCAPGKFCVAGACQDGCIGGNGVPVACPQGQTCQAGRCVDPCASITCATGQVCESGQCLPPCSCRACPTGKACGPNDVCVDKGCENTVCPTGDICVGGICRDSPCYMTLCPIGQYCSLGQCLPQPFSGGSGGAGGGPLIIGGGAGGASGAVDAAVDAADAGDVAKAYSKCACEVAAPPPLPLAVLAGLAAMVVLRRRRRGR